MKERAIRLISNDMKGFDASGFQGVHRTRAYFEGWYIRLSSDKHDWNCSLIPGIAIDPGGEPHAFLQFIESSGTSHYMAYPRESFSLDSNKLRIEFEGNVISEDEIKIDLSKRGLNLQIDIKGCDMPKFSERFHSLNVMGILSKFPQLPCYHHLIHMDLPVSGYIQWSGKKYSFNGGSAYMEKDWGRSFPSTWHWIQSSSFEANTGVLSAVASYVPCGKIKVPAGMAALQIDGEQYFWSSAWGHTWHYSESNSSPYYRFSNGKNTLEIIVRPGVTAPLIAPIKGAMERTVYESINSGIRLQVTDQRGKLLHESSSKSAGYERVV